MRRYKVWHSDGVDELSADTYSVDENNNLQFFHDVDDDGHLIMTSIYPAGRWLRAECVEYPD